MIKIVIRFQNNMVVVFDSSGEQLPGYQGQYEEVKASILKDAPPDAVFTHGFPDSGEFRGLQKVAREEW